MTTSKQLIVVAGPNGSGKTTFALEYLAERACVYLSADAIAEELSPDAPERKQFAAGRQFLAALDHGLALDESLLVESTLSGRRFSRVLEAARAAGFSHVPQEDIRRRFSRSLHNFWTTYRFLVDDWALVYNADSGFQDVAIGSGEEVWVREERLFGEFLALTRRNGV